MWNVDIHVYDILIVLLHKQISSELQMCEDIPREATVIEELRAVYYSLNPYIDSKLIN